MHVKLKKHIFCMLQIDDNAILCGQLGGYVDLVRISDGTVLLSQDLRSTCGNIISRAKTNNREYEVMGRLNAHQEASIFAQDLSQINDTETEFNKILETDPNFTLQT